MLYEVITNDVFGVLGAHDEVNTDTIEAVFALPYDIAGEKLRLSATTGLLRLDGGQEKAAELMKNASVALKQAKSFNRGKALV